MGRRRSAPTIAAFLMKRSETEDEAIKYIKSKKRDAFFPKVNFDGALNMFTERHAESVDV